MRATGYQLSLRAPYTDGRRQFIVHRFHCALYDGQTLLFICSDRKNGHPQFEQGGGSLVRVVAAADYNRSEEERVAHTWKRDGEANHGSSLIGTRTPSGWLARKSHRTHLLSRSVVWTTGN